MNKRPTRTVKDMELVWSSEPDEYEKATLEILLDANPIVTINEESGLDKLEAELFGPVPNGTIIYKLPLDDLIEALIKARNAMLRPRLR